MENNVSILDNNTKTNEIQTINNDQKTNQILTMENVNKKITFIAKEAVTVEEKKKLFNALEQCDELIKNKLGTEIILSNVYIECRQVFDETKNCLMPKYRTILFDDKSTSYVTGSYGVYNAVKRLLEIYGNPENWKEKVKVKFIEKNIGNNKKSLSLELI